MGSKERSPMFVRRTSCPAALASCSYMSAKCPDSVSLSGCPRRMYIFLAILHCRTELCPVFLHALESPFHLRLPALDSSVYLLTDLLEEFRILLHERHDLLALSFRHILHLPLHCCSQKEIQIGRAHV